MKPPKPITVARVGIPGSLMAAGIACLFVPDEYANGAGVVLIGSSALVALANGLLRASLDETHDRDREQAARDFYLEHGRWPEDPPPSS